MRKLLDKTISTIVMAAILTTFLVGVAAGCNQKDKTDNGENDMTTTTPRIPPIDALLPVKMETATFALG
jgi:hypothetical protein